MLVWQNYKSENVILSNETFLTTALRLGSPESKHYNDLGV